MFIFILTINKTGRIESRFFLQTQNITAQTCEVLKRFICAEVKQIEQIIETPGPSFK